MRLLARVFAEADEFIAGEDRAFDHCAGVLGHAAEFERDVGRADLEEMLHRRAGGFADGVGFELVLFAETGQQDALGFFA